MASREQSFPKLLKNAKELSSEIQTILSHRYSPLETDRRRQEVMSSGYRTSSTEAQTGGTDPRITVRQPRPDVRRKMEGVVTSTPGLPSPHRSTERIRAGSSPGMSRVRQD